ncbi:MAG: arylsulfatase, partial [Lentisphaerae bacterium]
LFIHAALAWIKQQHFARKRYFAYIALNAPHAPYIAPERYKKRFLEAGYDKKTAGRYGMIENIDDNFGLLWRKLNEWGALDNTILIFMTDNGMSMGTIQYKGKRLRAYNAGMRGLKNSPHEGGTHVPCFWYWKGVLPEGVDIPALTAHIDLYPTFCELIDAKLPPNVQKFDGRSLLPLLENPEASWPERKLFIHCGRWKTSEGAAGAKYKKCAVRTPRWRFVNNSELYDMIADPGQKNNVASNYPEVVKSLRAAYEQWWQSVQPYLVNENQPVIPPNKMPLAVRYYKQLKERGIPLWEPPEL